MTFLQPWLLYGLPLIALPVVIHLINQRRFQTIPWAAMMFLLAAHRMARGYSRIRQWLILAFRTLAVAGLIFAISRPLASGWLGLAGGSRPDTTIILLDRSPSMQQRGAGTGESKLVTGQRQLVQTLDLLGSGRWVLIDSAAQRPQEIDAPSALLTSPAAGPSSAPADLPLLLQSAYDYIRTNQTGRTDIWICSDQRENDWTPDSGRWEALRKAFLELPQSVRFHLLAYPETAPENTAIRVTSVERRAHAEGADLYVSLQLLRPQGRDDSNGATRSVPVQFEVEGVRSVVNVDVSGTTAELKEHRLPLDRSRERGWGRVSIPADQNPADDEYYFCFDPPPPRRTIVVSDDPQVERPLQLAASISPDPALECQAEVVSTEQLASVAWDELALVVWQAPATTVAQQELLESFVQRGGQLVLLPPRLPGSGSLFGVTWNAWVRPQESVRVESWRGDEDLLARTLSGAALPVGQIEISQYCTLSPPADATVLASLSNGAPLVLRLPTTRGGIVVWTTTPALQDSTLAANGVVLYAFVQRSLAAGAAALSKARTYDAGPVPDEDPAQWNRLSSAESGLSTELATTAGAYASGDRVLTINRPRREDTGRALSSTQIAELFQGLDYVQVNDQAGSLTALIQEIWRLFLALMIVALIAEALLCLPKPSRTPAGATA